MSRTVERFFHVANRTGRRGGNRRVLKVREEPSPPPNVEPARVHPLARRMAMAIHCEQLLRTGAVSDAASLAAMAHITRARMTQILSLTLLAPDIQENLLMLSIDSTFSQRDLRPIINHLSWPAQRHYWKLRQTDEYS